MNNKQYFECKCGEAQGMWDGETLTVTKNIVVHTYPEDTIVQSWGCLCEKGFNINRFEDCYVSHINRVDQLPDSDTELKTTTKIPEFNNLTEELNSITELDWQKTDIDEGIGGWGVYSE